MTRSEENSSSARSPGIVISSAQCWCVIAYPRSPTLEAAVANVRVRARGHHWRQPLLRRTAQRSRDAPHCARRPTNPGLPLPVRARCRWPRSSRVCWRRPAATMRFSYPSPFRYRQPTLELPTTVQAARAPDRGRRGGNRRWRRDDRQCSDRGWQRRRCDRNGFSGPR